MSLGILRYMEQQIVLVRIVVMTGDGRVLLLQRSDESQWSPDKFELPGGKIDPTGESLPAAVRRELLEETGLHHEGELPVLHVLTEFWQGKSYIITAYLLEIEDIRKITLSTEHRAYRWIKLNELQQISTTSHTIEILKKAFHISRSDSNLNKKETIDDTNTSISELIIYTDGGSRGNPGPSAAGYVIMDRQGRVLEEGGEYLGLTTNNQAEYQAVKLALEQALKYHAKRVTFMVDSELVERQMIGQYQIRNRDLWPVHDHIKEMIAAYEKVTFHHIPREKNVMADTKVNEILDSHK